MSTPDQRKQMTLLDYIRDLRTDVYGLSMVVASGMHGNEEQPSAIALTDRMRETLNRLEAQEAPPFQAANLQPILYRADINGAWAFWTNSTDDGMMEVIEGIEWHEEFDELFTRCGIAVVVPAAIPEHIKALSLIARFGLDVDRGYLFPAQTPNQATAQAQYQGPHKHRIVVISAEVEAIEIKTLLGSSVTGYIAIRGRGKTLEFHAHKWLIARLCDFVGIDYELK